ncbi:MAG: stage III sporulation protein AD [Oscillospiraceae bacterium]|nr:stage III sporulation protein AD [Oscillospiraceae bacterium]
MEEILKVSAIAVTAALCAMILQKNAQELGLVLALAAGILILGFALHASEGVLSLMDALGETAGMVPAVLSPVVKTVGIAVVTRITAEICRDAKEGGIAAFVETAGAALALFVALPLMEAVLETITGLI